MSHRIFQLLTTIHAADFLVESFDAFNEPSLHFTLTASRSYREHSLSLMTSAGTDSALLVLENKIQKQEIHYAPDNLRDTNDVGPRGHERGLQHRSRFRARR
jgi:hypothetical protein